MREKSRPNQINKKRERENKKGCWEERGRRRRRREERVCEFGGVERFLDFSELLVFFE